MDRQAKNNKMSVVKYMTIFKIMVLFLGASSTVFAWQTESAEEKGDIKIYRNLRYGDKPKGIGQDTSSDRILDLYIKDINKKLPVLMFIHGGGFGAGDKATKSNEALCLKMASHGFAVVSINYYLTLKYEKTPRNNGVASKYVRLPGNGFTPDKHKATKNASDDAQLALKWIKCNAKQYNLDLSSVAISGGSAGAMTALYTAYIADQKILPIKAVVNLWGCIENSNLIKKGAPPLLTYHGEQDKTINVAFAYDLEKQMKKMGNTQSETYILKDKGHAIYRFITAEKTDEIAAFLNKVLKID